VINGLHCSNKKRALKKIGVLPPGEQTAKVEHTLASSALASMRLTRGKEAR